MLILLSFSFLIKLFHLFSVSFFLACCFIVIWTSFLLLFFLFQSTVSYAFFIVIFSGFDLDKSNFFICLSKVKGFPVIGWTNSFQFLETYSAGYTISSFCSKSTSVGPYLFFNLPWYLYVLFSTYKLSNLFLSFLSIFILVVFIASFVSFHESFCFPLTFILVVNSTAFSLLKSFWPLTNISPLSRVKGISYLLFFIFLRANSLLSIFNSSCFFWTLSQKTFSFCPIFKFSNCGLIVE